MLPGAGLTLEPATEPRSSIQAGHVRPPGRWRGTTCRPQGHRAPSALGVPSSWTSPSWLCGRSSRGSGAGALMRSVRDGDGLDRLCWSPLGRLLGAVCRRSRRATRSYGAILRRPQRKYAIGTAPRELTSEMEIAQTAFEPRIAVGGRRARSASAAILRTPSTTLVTTTRRRVRGESSFHFSLAVTPLIVGARRPDVIAIGQGADSLGLSCRARSVRLAL